ncbi:radical SAM protein [Maridesulfovibrio ferrireducens]|uniref:radical SAM protein n=1 Tax=Maridesulfovibrio ferrireducens TaxID=246191 RepID=UPI001A2B1BD6|nr:radical SAM protein [Maridesulfovibrio ferrireducens]MBI9109617.1 radical SAM protein [Maridesulfovibrio ferrireducens]
MSDKYKIDSHKLHLHPARVAKWLAGENIGPIFMEVSPSGCCNHRCRFCGYDFMEYVPKFLDYEIYKKRINTIADTGLKSIVFSGEGEPFMNTKFTDICIATTEAGIDIGIATNGVLMTPDKLEKIIHGLSWVKVSCNGITPGSYQEVHRSPDGDFQKVMNNLKEAVAIRKRTGSDCVLGLQSLLLPENASEMINLAEMCRDIGLDYIVIKPYSQHPQGITKEFEGLTYEEFVDLGKELRALETDSFKVIYREKTMDRLQEQDKGYERCLALPFWSYMDVDLNIWGCGIFIGDNKFLYGNLREQNFKEIWDGDKRAQSLSWCNDNLDPQKCRVNCRMDKMNIYLWELCHPGPHVNFI